MLIYMLLLFKIRLVFQNECFISEMIEICDPPCPQKNKSRKWKKIERKLKEGVRWILEVDLDYPEELLKESNSYPFIPKKKVIEKELMTIYQKHLMEDLKLDPPRS